MPRLYVPNSGDVVCLFLNPQAGDEQVTCEALVLSPSRYNRKTGLMLCCPIVVQKGNPFEVQIVEEGSCAVLSDQIKSLDWKARKAEFKGKVSSAVLNAVRMRALALIGHPGNR
ncbi:type II toxin-antitoxin system PemK/MazF family toxin [Pseudomonas zeae]|uniref:type II toxin-antitoxin system PemK/MazF family toxin n=1 Tax=Pseudomonas zeae TaxID=2745510 RepID=UPI0039E1163C